MKRKQVLLCCVSIFVLVILATAQETVWFEHIIKPAIEAKKPLQKERQIHPGVLHRSEFDPAVPSLINLVKVDLSQNQIRVEAEKGNDALFQGEKTSHVSERENVAGHMVVAAINCDFWRGKYIPVGPFVDDGIIYKSHRTVSPRAAFLMDDQGIPYIYIATLDAVLVVDEATTCPIDVINEDGDAKDIPPEQNDMYLYNEVFGDSTGTSPVGRTEVILKRISGDFIPNNACRAEVIEVRKTAGNSSLAKNIMVLSGVGTAQKFLDSHLKAGMTVTIQVTVPGVERPIPLMVGGMPLLIEEGEIRIDHERENIRKAFVTDKHPRTAIGFSRDKKTLFLFTIDGRQPGISIGADLYEVAEYLKKEGAWYAMNLDGGGSTTMWVRGEIVNSPSDRTGERTVTNSLLVVSKTKPSEPQYIVTYPEILTLATECSAQILVRTYDAMYNPMPLPDEKYICTVEPQIGSCSENLIFSAGKESAQGIINIKIKDRPGVAAQIPVDIGQLDAIRTEQDAVVLRSGDSETLDVTLCDKEGNELSYRASDLVIETPPFIERKEATLEFFGKSQGKGRITITVGETQCTLPVFVDMFTELIIQDFDSIPEPLPGEQAVINGSNYDPEKTTLSIEETEKKQGAASCRIDYVMLPGGTTAIYMPVNATIEKKPYEIAIWVYGDGKNGWLRGEIIDKDNESFLVDFTSGAAGISWEGWRQLRINDRQISPKWTNPGATLEYPAVFKTIYLAQSREEYKATGFILLDALTVVYPPVE